MGTRPPGVGIHAIIQGNGPGSDFPKTFAPGNGGKNQYRNEVGGIFINTPPLIPTTAYHTPYGIPTGVRQGSIKVTVPPKS